MTKSIHFTLNFDLYYFSPYKTQMLKVSGAYRARSSLPN